MCQVWLQLVQWFWRRRFLNFVIVIWLFHYYFLALRKKCGPSFLQTWIPTTKGYFVPSLVEINQGFLEKKIFKFGQCIFAISLLSPLKKRCGPLFVKFESPLHKNALCLFCLKLVQWFWRRSFLNFINIFRDYLPCKRAGPLS